MKIYVKHHDLFYAIGKADPKILVHGQSSLSGNGYHIGCWGCLGVVVCFAVSHKTSLWQVVGQVGVFELHMVAESGESV